MSIDPPAEGTYSRRSLSVITVVLVLLALGGGVAWRLLASREASADAPDTGSALPEGFELPEGSGAPGR